MITEYKLPYTGEQINNKLSMIDQISQNVEKLEDDLKNSEITGISTELSNVLKIYFTNIQSLLPQLAYATENNAGNILIQNAKDITAVLGGEEVVTLMNISAIYTGGSMPVGTNLDSLTGITVTAHYSNGSTSDVLDYTLSGTIDSGENIIAVYYGGMNTTFTVNGFNVLTYEPAFGGATYNLTKNEDNTYNMDFQTNGNAESKYYATLLKSNGEYVNELTMSYSDLADPSSEGGEGDTIDLIIVGYNANDDYPYYSAFLSNTQIEGWRFYWNANVEFKEDASDHNNVEFSSTDVERIKLSTTTSGDDIVFTVSNADTNEVLATKTFASLAANGYIPAIGIGGQHVPNTYSNISV